MQSYVEIAQIKREVSDDGKVIDNNRPQFLENRAKRVMSLNTRQLQIRS